MSDPRQTIATTVALSGVGIHSGITTTLTFRPGDGRGVVFRRVDLPGHPELTAGVEQVRSSARQVVLADGAACVHTVEHVLAAVWALRVDDLVIELDGAEVPGVDGSAAPFVEALRANGFVATKGAPHVVRLDRPLRVHEGSSVYTVAPRAGLRLGVTIEWNHPLIGRQHRCFDIPPECFAAELAGARTFGFRRDADELRRAGLAGGVTTENAIILSDLGVEGGAFRWPDEPLRHKVVDLVGDLALLGARLEAEIVALRPGHTGNVALVKALAKRSTKPEA